MERNGIKDLNPAKEGNVPCKPQLLGPSEYEFNGEYVNALL